MPNAQPFLDIPIGAQISYNGELAEYYGFCEERGEHDFAELNNFGYSLDDADLRAGLANGTITIRDVAGYCESTEEATGAVAGQLAAFEITTSLDRRSYQSCPSEELGQRRICVFGCGAVGSKIATSLKRSGVGTLQFVDDELAHGRNPVWGDIGRNGETDHPAEWLARRIQSIDPGVHPFDKAAIQHTYGLVRDINKVRSRIQQYDLIIDATSSGTVSDLVADWADDFLKPLVWLDVFSAGLGGVVARHVPEDTVSARVMRRNLKDWYAETRAPVFDACATPSKGRVWFPEAFTDESAVSAVAAYAAAVSVDIVARRPERVYTDTAYVIGVRKGWIFERPFETRPLDLSVPRVRRFPDLGDQKAELNFSALR